MRGLGIKSILDEVMKRFKILEKYLSSKDKAEGPQVVLH